MDTITIIDDLNRRFEQPLKEFYTRRIIFWYDENGEFEDSIGDLQLARAKVLILNGHNYFAAKKLLAIDDPQSDYLVYCPMRENDMETDWLLDVKLYSEDFRADLYSIWLDEMGLPSTPALRAQVKAYKKFFKAKERRARVAAMREKIHTAAHLHNAVMAVLAGLRWPDPNGVLRAVLCAGLDMRENAVYQRLVEYGADGAFFTLAAQASGYQAAEPNLRDLAAHILLTAATRTLHMIASFWPENLTSPPHQGWCCDFVADWQQRDADGTLFRIARDVEREHDLYQAFSGCLFDELLATSCFPCVNERILEALMAGVLRDTAKPAGLAEAVERRRAMAWYDAFACYYEGLLQVAEMLAFRQKHAAGFHMVDAKEVFAQYTQEFYRMDTFYRLFRVAFGRALHVMNPRLDDRFKAVAEKVEGLYSHWFLGKLSECWTNASEIDLKDLGGFRGVPRQVDFYAEKVATADTRVFVIVSDALRYEVAAALAEQLRRETQSKVTLESRQGIFPTITKFGMAALLPHGEISVREKPGGALQVLLDGKPCEAGDRDGILKAANAQSVALRCKDIIDMKRADRAALVRGMDIVYIYHDRIDEASHADDADVFAACEQAIGEIKTLIRIIVNEFSGTRVLVTADHGFLYTGSVLREDSKVSACLGGKVVEMGRRYAIAQKGAAAAALMPVCFLEDATPYAGFAPRENIRLKMSGAGINFVHGGVSLQEMAVPVIDYRRLRSESRDYRRNREKYEKKPVTVRLLSSDRKIYNMAFSLNFYQQEPVSGNRSACSYLAYFRDAAGRTVSDTVKIIADRTDEDGRARVFRCAFNLKPQRYSGHDAYELVIRDEEGKQTPVTEAFQIDIAFSTDGLDFFS